MQLFGRVTEGLGTALDLYQARHQVLAENIANCGGLCRAGRNSA